MLQFALVEGFKPELEFSEPLWLEAIGARVYHTPQYGKVPLTVDRVQQMVKNFKENVRGQEIATNFDHGMDAAKGNKASGWFRDFKVAPSSDDPTQMSLYASVQFTEEAAQEIKNGAWKYFSLEWDDLWVDNTGNKHQDVITGGAITNRPVAKNLAALPINFSETLWNELTDDEKKEYTTAVNTLRRKNHSLAIAKDKKMSEEVIKEIEEGKLVILDESKEWEHSEPGTGAPQIGSPEQPDPGTTQPVPRIQGDPAGEDPAIGEGWRRDPLPLDPSDPRAPKAEINNDNRDEGGSALTPEELAELRTKLKLPADAPVVDIIAAADKAFSESVSFREAVALAGEEKEFAEKNPRMYAEHVKMREEGNENRAIKFSESVQTITKPEGDNLVPTRNGLSALAAEKVTETHKKFSEGTATIVDFEETVRAITQGGIVEFGERGSNQQGEELVIHSTNTVEGIANNRKLFAEKVAEIQKKDELTLTDAMREAAKQYPELAEAYRATAAA